ncbi:MAG: helix-turn-helix domain-containing protein [Planctomycetota bacterium]
MARDDLITADEASRLLGCAESELQEMVQNQELRAFRSGGAIKFRREDVMNIKAAKSEEPTIILPATGGSNQSGILDSVDDVERTQPMMLDDLDILPDGDDITQELASPNNSPVTDDFIPTVLDDNLDSPTLIDDDLSVDDGLDDDDLSVDDESFDDEDDGVGDSYAPAAGIRRDAAVYVKQPGNPVMSTVLFVAVVVMLMGALVVGTRAYRGDTIVVEGIPTAYNKTEIHKPFMPDYGKFIYELVGGWFMQKRTPAEISTW